MSIRKKFIYLVNIFAGSLFFVWFVVGEYWNGKLPRVPDESTGNVYPIAFHGTDGYANWTQITIFWAIPVTGGLIVILTTLIDYHLRKKNRHGDTSVWDASDK